MEEKWGKNCDFFPEKYFSDKLVKPKVFMDRNCNFNMYINKTYFSASY